MIKKATIQKIGIDGLLNVISYGLPIVVLQFLVFPIIAKWWDTNEYALMLALTAIVGVAAEMTGGTLTNVRLIDNSKYADHNLVGDYKRIFIISSFIGSLIIFALLLFYYELNVYHITLIILYYILFSTRAYLSVGYRLNLRFKMIFANNIFLCLGYFIGILFAKLLDSWEYIFIIGFVLCVAHILFTTDQWKEPMAKTKLYTQTKRKYYKLMGAYLIGNSMNYFDRVFLLAVVSPIVVSQYYVATVFGKVLNLLIAPINMVLLSYLSHKKSMSNLEISFCSGLLIIIGGLFICSVNFLAPILLGLLYPQYSEGSLQIVGVATTATVIMACSSFFKTCAIRYISENIVLLIEIIYIVTYVLLAIILLTNHGIVGFCIAAIIADLLKFILFLSSLYFNNYKKIKL